MPAAPRTPTAKAVRPKPKVVAQPVVVSDPTTPQAVLPTAQPALPPAPPPATYSALAAPPPVVPPSGDAAPGIDPVVWSVVLLLVILVPAALAALLHPVQRSGSRT
ncbi:MULTISPECIES: hypothetical protein [unclassified Kitasatospora]|uniref:hypothetical protein n=1 Tax=unclassified Kitasatospora TaxID=2633591 RepID=UPI0012F9E253|nr:MULTISPECIES: hypothetical protein [unclassified Kitasatospora]